MATAKPHTIRRGPRRAGLRRVLLAVAVLIGLALALFWTPLHGRAVLGASYGARIGCTCHYVEGRGLKDCRQDFEPGMALVMLSDNPQTRTITARVPLVAKQTASFRDGWGCLLQPWAP